RRRHRAARRGSRSALRSASVSAFPACVRPFSLILRNDPQVLVDSLQTASRRPRRDARHFSGVAVRRLLSTLLLLLAAQALASDLGPQRAQFQAAWRLAQTGVDASARYPALGDYPLYPY